MAETLTPPAPARPAAAPGTAPHSHGETPARRQIVCFGFYKVMPEWRRLPAAEKSAHKAAFSAVLDKCVWTIGYGVDELNRMRAELMATPLGGYLTSPHNFLAMTKRSQYQI